MTQVLVDASQEAPPRQRCCAVDRQASPTEGSCTQVRSVGSQAAQATQVPSDVLWARQIEQTVPVSQDSVRSLQSAPARSVGGLATHVPGQHCAEESQAVAD